MTNQTPPQSPEQGDAELERILDTYGVSHKRPLLQPESRVNLMRDLKVWRDKHQPTEASPERPEAPQDIPTRIYKTLANYSSSSLYSSSANAKEVAAVVAKDAILTLIREIGEAVIGEHLSGCPAITRYVGEEGTPFDGPACDCGVLGARTRLDEMLGKP